LGAAVRDTASPAAGMAIAPEYFGTVLTVSPPKGSVATLITGADATTWPFLVHEICRFPPVWRIVIVTPDLPVQVPFLLLTVQVASGTTPAVASNTDRVTCCRCRLWIAPVLAGVARVTAFSGPTRSNSVAGREMAPLAQEMRWPGGVRLRQK